MKVLMQKQYGGWLDQEYSFMFLGNSFVGSIGKRYNGVHCILGVK